MNTVGTPAYSAKLKHQQKKCTIVDLCDLTELEVEEPTSYSSAVVIIGYKKPTISDFGCFKSSISWLNDRLVNAGQVLLQKKLPNVHGLQNVSLARTLSFVQQNGPLYKI